MRTVVRPVVLTVVLVGLAGCTGERGGWGFGSSTAGAPPPTARMSTPPPTDMAGRWTFSGSGRSCAMNFGPAQEAEGTIRPEGGCPGNFFTSRRWTFENNELVIRDHTGAALAQLRLAGAGRFDGQSGNGQPVSLTR